MLLLLMLIYSCNLWRSAALHYMKFTPVPIVLLLVFRHNVYRKELRIVSNIKINFRSGIKKRKTFVFIVSKCVLQKE